MFVTIKKLIIIKKIYNDNDNNENYNLISISIEVNRTFFVLHIYFFIKKF